jgi:Bacterial regulatory proteins, gntR family
MPRRSVRAKAAASRTGRAALHRRSSSGSTPPRACRPTCSLRARSSTCCGWATSSPGDQLPKVRDVVASLAINPRTRCSKAYRELETKGLALGRPGRGTFIERIAGPEVARTE